MLKLWLMSKACTMSVMILLTASQNKLQNLIQSNTPAARVSTRDIQSRRLSHLGRAIGSVVTETQAIPKDSDDTYLIQQYSDWLAELKSELKTIHQELLTLGLDERDELFNVYARS